MINSFGKGLISNGLIVKVGLLFIIPNYLLFNEISIFFVDLLELLFLIDQFSLIVNSLNGSILLFCVIKINTGE
jgi:hypothetical protein